MRSLVLAALLLATPAAAAPLPQPKPMTAQVLTGSTTIGPMSSRYYDVHVNATSSAQSRLIGRVIAAGGEGHHITVAVLTEAAFVDWNGHREAPPLYYSGLVKTADVAVPLRESGNYYLIVSNVSQTPTTVSGSIETRWTQLPSVAEVAAANAANQAELERALRAKMSSALALALLFGALAVGVGAFLVATWNRKVVVLAEEEPELREAA